MTIRPFETLDRVRHRIAEALISQSGLRHPALGLHLRKTLTSAKLDGALIPQPVLEGAFPFEPAEKSLGELSGSLLDPRLVDALIGDGSGDGYSFPRMRAPYKHQLSAWRTLMSAETKSAVVTAGTGSGKTECFLVPILDSLYRAGTKVTGVEAIMLYPLNALIASQQERLDEWTRPAKGAIRYCLYNGNLPETLSSHELKASLASAPQTVPNREQLRQSPPPILVTNLTMLEYMLVRPADQPIIQASKGRLKWIVLDEAHTLVGSAAAEVALLLRRVMEAFDVDPSSVRFIATSATIGDRPEVYQKLRQFLADMGGVDVNQVELVSGSRRLPTRPGNGGPVPDPSELVTLGPAELYDRLGKYDPVWDLVEALKASTISTEALNQIGQAIGVDGEALAMAMSRAESATGETLAPLRVHSFHRALPGLWSCTNPGCPDGMKDGWNAGRILFERKEDCPACKMPVAELFSCNECGEAFMMAEEQGGRLRPPRNIPPSDEFLFDAVRDALEADADEDEGADKVDSLSAVMHCFSLSDAGLMPLFVDTENGRSADCGGVGRYKLTSHGNGKGPCPACSAKSKGRDKLYPFRFGAPFIVSNAAPILLSAMPPSNKVQVPALPQTAPDMPASGRQLLSFTDSRQGTARMAAKLQIESERAFVRSFIYQMVQHKSGGTGDTEEMQRLKDQNEKIKARSGWQVDDLFVDLVKENEAKLSKLAGSASVSWTELCTALSDRIEVRDWLPEVWGDRAGLFSKGNSSGASKLSEALLLREMLRRPRQANSMETMGLVRLVYPAIEKNVDAPRSFITRGGTVNDWKAWLICLIVFSVRNSLAVAVNHELLQWIMRKGFPKSLARPGLEPGNRQQRWPQATFASNQPAVVDLLRLGLSVDPKSNADQFEINEWLERAWTQLAPLFPLSGNGECALDFGQLEIAAVKNAFYCPVTRRITDIAPFSLSPYARTARDVAEPISFPMCPAHGSVEVRRSFVETDQTVAALRARGLWTDMHDRIALFSPYARSAEHSAQIEPARLRRYEAAFKSGQINFLNCSTTMEMGVDIGSVNGVMMTNVPPSIANYRQRVGRAGRRGQPLSLAFTFAKDRPLDREAFEDPAKYLKRTIAAPRVALDSRQIVQRHINAFLFSRFLSIQSGNALKLKAGEFFGCPDAPSAARRLKAERPVASFVSWLGEARTLNETESAVRRLTRGSVLAGRMDLVSNCTAEIEDVEKQFAHEWSMLQVQVPTAAGIGASGAIEAHLKRLCGEFLLAELADRGFLPGHGFPNHVVSFEIGQSIANSERNDDRRGRRHGGPQRPLDIALRDYAPGSETVVDGQVYRVGGVTLNWQRPSNEDGVREIQALRWAARCAHCGNSWTGAGNWPELCDTCGDASVAVENYLKPSGFLRDFQVEPHAEVDKVDYIRPESARISAGSAVWEALSDPTAGRFRLNRRGTVFYQSKGPAQAGYGLCLRCGRMEPMRPPEITCTGLVDHKPLRARENFTEPCAGNNETFAIRPYLNLGHEIHTDVFELQPAALASVGAANAIAIALREAVARHLGIEPDEIGFGIGVSRNAIANSTFSIFLHDRAAGGAGYVVRAAEDLRAILKSARSILSCPHDCPHACSACVLVSDAPEREDDLDRKAAIAFMDQHLRLSDSIAPADVFAAGADISNRPLVEIDVCLNISGGASLILWAAPTDIVELADWQPSALFARWASNGRKVTLVLPEGFVDRLDGSQLLFLRDYATRGQIVLAEGAPPSFANGAVLFAYVAGEESGHAWACRDKKILTTGPQWGANHLLPVAKARLKIALQYVTVDSARLKPPANAVVTVLDESLDGPISGFGVKMGKAISTSVKACGVAASDRLSSAIYRDRYARSPLVLKLLLDTMKAVAREQALELSIETASDRGGFSRNHVASDAEDNAVLEGLASAYGKQSNLSIKLSVGQPSHKRSLLLRFDSGATVSVDLDQGFGWVSYEGHDRYFDFAAPPGEGAVRLGKLAGKIQRRHGHNSQMVVWRDK